jgi:hypothetical protein
MSNAPSATLADDLKALLAGAPGKGPAQDALTALGSWERVAAEGATMADNRWLVLLTRLVVRDVAVPDNQSGDYVGALRSITAAVIATESPAIFAESLDALLTSSVALNVIGGTLARSLEDIVDACHELSEMDLQAALRAADALEALTRLSVSGVGPSFGLLALLERFNAPIPKPLATAVIRAIGTAVDYWPHAESLVSVVRLVAGMEPPAGKPWTGADPEDVASDAAWVLAGIELVRALRSPALTAMAECLEGSATYLKLAADSYNREDADILLTVVDILRGLLQEAGVAPTADALSMPQLEPKSLGDLAERILQFNVASSGLNHWYGDSKRSALLAWQRLADDLGRMRVEFARNSFYKAEVVVDDLLQIYTGSRGMAVARLGADSDGLLDLIQPVIETGFARTAGLMSNLEDHTYALQQRMDSAPEETREYLTEQLRAAHTVLSAARAHALGGAGPGKGGGGAVRVPLPPPLDQLVPPGSETAELSTMSEAVLTRLARAIDDATIGRHSLNLIEAQVHSDIRAALGTSPDYRGEAASAVDVVLRLMIRFVTTRTNAQSDLYAYLFDPEAKEDAIHRDLYDYLASSELGSVTEFEVQHVGGGRVDLRLKFDGFAIHIEMKFDATRVPMNDKTAYLKQAAAYQGTDIRIGFLVALRHKAFDASGPPPHLSTLIGHTAFDIDGDPVPRHIITVQVPGSRTKPSRMK